MKVAPSCQRCQNGIYLDIDNDEDNIAYRICQKCVAAIMLKNKIERSMKTVKIILADENRLERVAAIIRVSQDRVPTALNYYDNHADRIIEILNALDEDMARLSSELKKIKKNDARRWFKLMGEYRRDPMRVSNYDFFIDASDTIMRRIDVDILKTGKFDRDHKTLIGNCIKATVTHTLELPEKQEELPEYYGAHNTPKEELESLVDTVCTEHQKKSLKKKSFSHWFIRFAKGEIL